MKKYEGYPSSDKSFCKCFRSLKFESLLSRKRAIRYLHSVLFFGSVVSKYYYKLSVCNFSQRKKITIRNERKKIIKIIICRLFSLNHMVLSTTFATYAYVMRTLNIAKLFKPIIRLTQQLLNASLNLQSGIKMKR